MIAWWQLIRAQLQQVTKRCIKALYSIYYEGDVPVNNQQSHDITSNQTQEESNDNVAATTEPTNCVEYATIIDEVLVKGQQAYPDLVFAKRMGDGSTILDVTQSNMKNIPNAGYIYICGKSNFVSIIYYFML